MLIVGVLDFIGWALFGDASTRVEILWFVIDAHETRDIESLGISLLVGAF